jgi:hypothetical protein
MRPLTQEAVMSTQTTTGDVMELLRLHVPLTLLVDLIDPGGPRSRELLDDERFLPVRTA